ncbi:MAG: DUF3568 family protein [Oceanipulchritudo sp.]|jgi:hypothetical protein
MKTPFPRPLFLLSLLLLVPLAFSGCVAVVAAGGAAAGTVAYVRGELQIVLDDPVKNVNDAVEQTAEALELYTISRERDLLAGKFVYRNAQDEKITIKTEAQTRQMTKLGIRVGVFGDQQQSQLILDEIRRRL